MKKLLKKFSVTIACLCLMMIVVSKGVFAADYDYKGTISSLEGKGTGVSVITVTENIMGTLINTIKIVGTGIAVIMLVWVAIKYMSAAPAEKADFKKSATAFVVGAVVLFASSNILSIIYNFASTNISG